MTKKAEKTRISITFPGDLYEWIEASAAASERSVNGEVIFALRQYQAVMEEAPGDIRERFKKMFIAKDFD